MLCGWKIWLENTLNAAFTVVRDSVNERAAALVEWLHHHRGLDYYWRRQKTRFLYGQYWQNGRGGRVQVPPAHAAFAECSAPGNSSISLSRKLLREDDPSAHLVNQFEIAVRGTSVAKKIWAKRRASNVYYRHH